MKIKHKPEDFRVRELLDDAYLKPKGRFRVYRVIKKKLTSLEAAAMLAEDAGVAAADIGLAGLKDRQGVTTQYMSVPKGRIVSLRTPELHIEIAGFASEPLAPEFSAGNAFEIVIRDVTRGELAKLADAANEVRATGVANYFGEQRFGNLRFHQGWIARDLLLGEHERALKSLLATPSANDDDRNAKFKTALATSWGNWRSCRAIAGKFGAHHSVFEHLARHDGDFAGAFQFVSSRLRLIHLYAWQSHLWNRAVARYVEEATPPDQRIVLSTPEGRLYFARTAMAVDETMQNQFRLPGPRLEDVTHPRQLELLSQALQREGLTPEQFHIDGVPGFQLKGEDRALILHPRELRIAPVESDRAPRGEARVELSFALPRGAYATLILDRLFADARPPSKERSNAPRGSSGTSRDRSVAGRDRSDASRGRSDGIRGRSDEKGDRSAARHDRSDASRDRSDASRDRSDGNRDHAGAGRRRSNQDRERPDSTLAPRERTDRSRAPSGPARDHSRAPGQRSNASRERGGSSRERTATPRTRSEFGSRELGSGAPAALDADRRSPRNGKPRPQPGREQASRAPQRPPPRNGSRGARKDGRGPARTTRQGKTDR